MNWETAPYREAAESGVRPVPPATGRPGGPLRHPAARLGRAWPVQEKKGGREAAALHDTEQVVRPVNWTYRRTEWTTRGAAPACVRAALLFPGPLRNPCS